MSESALTTRINAARSAIGDSGAEQRLIKTLARKGLRFVGAVREEANPGMVGVEAAKRNTRRLNCCSLTSHRSPFCRFRT